MSKNTPADAYRLIKEMIKSVMEKTSNDIMADPDYFKTIDLDMKDELVKAQEILSIEQVDLLNDSRFLTDIITCLLEEAVRLNHGVTELKDIIEYSPDSIVVADGTGKILLANKAFESVTGVSASKVVGRNATDLEKEEVFTPCINDLVRKEKRRLTLIQKTQNGKKVVATGVPVFNDAGNIYRVIFNAQDLNQLNQLKEFWAGYNEIIKKPANGVNITIDIIAQSKIMKDLLRDAQAVAKANSTVLITGESGVGKEVIARYIHQSSSRSRQKFVQINCGAIPESLLESELFGYEVGAFTGALKGGKVGLIETADKGTLFLDEIAELPVNMQVKLLTAIQNKQITKVGGNQPIDIDVRYIAATNKNLEQMVENGEFRLDLFYRLNVIPINIPALRDRKEDIVPLIENVLDKMNRQFQKNISLSHLAVKVLLDYDWPGNIRELENVIERIVVTAKKSIISKEDLPIFTAKQTQYNLPVVVNEVVTLEKAFEEVEKQLIHMTYNNCGSSYKIAKTLGISQSAAYRKMQKYLKKKC